MQDQEVIQTIWQSGSLQQRRACNLPQVTEFSSDSGWEATLKGDEFFSSEIHDKPPTCCSEDLSGFGLITHKI